MILVVFFIVAALSIAVLAIGRRVYTQYSSLQIAECRSLVSFQTASLESSIRTLQDNVRQLALAGELLYESGLAGHGPPGRLAVVRNFQINAVAVGGGIWYKPYILFPERERVCYYAFTSDGSVFYSEGYESAEYHYPTQGWYVSIQAQLDAARGATGPDVVWTPPYVDDTGPRSLMTTAGCGIYDRDGEFVGMATVDWQLGDIAAQIASLKPTAGSFALFADTMNDYILAHGGDANGEHVGSSLSSIEWFDLDSPPVREINHGGHSFLSFTTILDNGMAVAVNVPAAELFREINRAMLFTLSALVGTVLLIVTVTWLLLNRFITRPVTYLSSTAAAIGGGNLDAVIDLPSGDELGALASSFNTMTRNLKEYISNLGAVTAEKERFATELNIAHDIQCSMLPSIFPAFPDRPELDLHAFMLPAKQVGGDFYDFFLIDDSRLVVVIADVSDKGVPAALFMVIAKTLIRNNAMNRTDPGEILAAANVQLCESNGTDMFVTAVVGVLDLRTGVFTYANAGHNPIMLRRSGGTFAAMPMPKGLFLAAMNNAVYRSVSVVLGRGDTLLLYTDGVTEASSPDGIFLGEDRLLASLNSQAGDVRTLLGGVKRDIDVFANGADQHDDITMLALQYYGPGTGVQDSENAPSLVEVHQEVRGGVPYRIEHRVFPASVACLHDFLNFLDAPLAEAGFAEKQRIRMAVAAEELFVNIASYAFPESPESGQVEVRLELYSYPDRADLTLIDCGRPFNPLAREEPDIGLPPEKRGIGGLGVYLAGRFSDSIRYARKDGKNMVSMTVFLDTEEQRL